VVVRRHERGGQTIDIEAYRVQRDEREVELYCRSRAREAKEEAMEARAAEKFLEALSRPDEGLSLPRRTKDYEKILTRICRLQERYAHAARHYRVDVFISSFVIPPTPQPTSLPFQQARREPGRQMWRFWRHDRGF
jgi:hypothetical protein